LQERDAGSFDAGSPDAVFKAVDAIGETEARSILSDVFRGAGYRILYDVMVSSSVALDGFDPRKKVGYEYVAVGDLAAPSGLESVGQVLVLGPSSREKITEQAKAFVKALADQAPKP